MNPSLPTPTDYRDILIEMGPDHVEPEETRETLVTADPTLVTGDDPEVARARQRIAAAVMFVLMGMSIIAADAFAFANGATATLSQLLLWLNTRYPWGAWVLAVLCGMLIQHSSIPGPPRPGYLPERAFWLQAIPWTLAFWLGRWIAWKWLWQTNSVD